MQVCAVRPCPHTTPGNTCTGWKGCHISREVHTQAISKVSSGCHPAGVTSESSPAGPAVVALSWCHCCTAWWTEMRAAAHLLLASRLQALCMAGRFSRLAPWLQTCLPFRPSATRGCLAGVHVLAGTLQNPAGGSSDIGCWRPSSNMCGGPTNQQKQQSKAARAHGCCSLDCRQLCLWLPHTRAGTWANIWKQLVAE